MCPARKTRSRGARGRFLVHTFNHMQPGAGGACSDAGVRVCTLGTNQIPHIYMHVFDARSGRRFTALPCFGTSKVPCLCTQTASSTHPAVSDSANSMGPHLWRSSCENPSAVVSARAARLSAATTSTGRRRQLFICCEGLYLGHLIPVTTEMQEETEGFLRSRALIRAHDVNGTRRRPGAFKMRHK